MVRKEEKFRVNERIIASEVRVVGEDGDMLGVMPSGDAVSMAADKGLDLVEIAPKAKPPTCKIMDYGKWKFKLSKKEKISRKNQVKIIIKEIQMRPRTDVHDLEIKMRKAKEFLKDGCKVKIHLRYSGREMAHKELGLKMLDRVKEILLPVSVLETDIPQVEKRSVFLFFAPDPVKLKELQKQRKALVKGDKKREDQSTVKKEEQGKKLEDTESKQVEATDTESKKMKDTESKQVEVTDTESKEMKDTESKQVEVTDTESKEMKDTESKQVEATDIEIEQKTEKEA